MPPDPSPRPQPPQLAAPWAITEDGLKLVLAVASRDEFYAEIREQALSAKKGERLENTRATEKRDGVAVIPIAGPLFRKAGLFAEVSGATSYATIRRDLETALAAEDVRAILLDIDSPGGEVSGVAELADAIYQARGRKPMIAYVGGQAASAAYWLASQATEIVAAQTAVLGSIGVRAAIFDTRRAEDAAGVRTVEIVSTQSPHKSVDPSDHRDIARMQARVDDMAEIFIAAVARGRRRTPEEVRSGFGGGDVFVGSNAVGAGLADRLGNFEATLADLAAISPPSAQQTITAAAPGLPPGDEDMEKLAQAMRTDLGLSAEAGEDEILASLEKRRAEAQAHEEQLVANAKQAQAAQQTLEQRVRALELEQLTAELDAAINDMRCEPAERADMLALASKDAALFRSILGKRSPRKLGGEIKPPPSAGDGAGSAEARALKAVEEYQAANPGTDYTAAYMAVAKQRPELFESSARGEA
jgi:signal peptide peptidase SppA